MSSSAEGAIAGIGGPAASATSALSRIARLDEEIFLRLGALRPRWLVRAGLVTQADAMARSVYPQEVMNQRAPYAPGRAVDAALRELAPR